jgi:Flp pilus assembly pilin Flp
LTARDGAPDPRAERGIYIMLRHLLIDDSAQGMTEYAILVGTVVFGTIIILIGIGSRIKDVFTNVQTQMNNVPTS